MKSRRQPNISNSTEDQNRERDRVTQSPAPADISPQAAAADRADSAVTASAGKPSELRPWRPDSDSLLSDAME